MPPYVYRDPARARHRAPSTTEAAVIRAITAPDTVTSRRQHETHAAWQARAVLHVVEEAVRDGREPFAAAWDDAVAAGAAAERAAIISRARVKAGDGLASIVADMLEEP